MSNNKILNEENLEVLKHVQSAFAKEAIIAGGAVRDFVMGNPYRDVDIWIPTNKKLVAKGLELILPKKLKFGDDDYISNRKKVERDGAFMVSHDPYSEGCGGYINELHNLHYRGDLYQLIFVAFSDPRELVKKFFDFNFNKAWHDGTSVTTTPEFEEDRKNKTLTYDQSQFDPDNIKKLVAVRAAKLLARYPEFKLTAVGKAPKKKVVEDIVWGDSNTAIGGVDPLRRADINARDDVGGWRNNETPVAMLPEGHPLVPQDIEALDAMNVLWTEPRRNRVGIELPTGRRIALARGWYWNDDMRRNGERGLFLARGQEVPEGYFFA